MTAHSWIFDGVFVLFAAIVVKSTGVFERHGCPDGWVVYQESCYLFDATQKFDWTDAAHYCYQHYTSHLLVLDSVSEHNFVKDFLGKYSKAGTYEYYWIGATDSEVEGVWTWYTDHRHVASGYHDWYPGEPDNSATKDQDCGLVLDGWRHYRMGNTLCTWDERAICELNSTYAHMPQLIGR